MSEAKPTAAGQPSDRQRPAHFRRPPVALRGEKTVASLGLWRRWLLGWHSRVSDRDGARFERISTAEPAQLADLTVDSPNLTYANDYLPSPRRLIGWALDCLPEPVDDFVFIDVGSGRGRVLFEASHRPFERIVGIEFAEELHEDADTNLRHWPRSQMACRDIDLIHADALEEPLPEADLVVYMFNPFGLRPMRHFTDKLNAHAREFHVHVIVLDPRNAGPLRESSEFEQVKLTRAQASRFGFWSPYRLDVFRSHPPAPAAID